MCISYSYYANFIENPVYFYYKEQNNTAVFKSVFLRLCEMKDSLKSFTISEDSFPKFPTTHEKEHFFYCVEFFCILDPRFRNTSLGKESFLVLETYEDSK